MAKSVSKRKGSALGNFGCVPSCLLALGFDWRGWPDHQGKKSCSFILPTATTFKAQRSCRFLSTEASLRQLVFSLKSVYKFASVWPVEMLWTNHCEGFHCRLNSYFHARPSFFALLEVLKEIQATTEREIILQRLDQEVRTGKQLQKTQKILEAKNVYLAGEIDALTFLGLISRRIFKPAVVLQILFLPLSLCFYFGFYFCRWFWLLLY